MPPLHMVTVIQRTVFFECVSKCRFIHSSKSYTSVRLSERVFNYKMYAVLRNWHKDIKLTLI